MKNNLILALALLLHPQHAFGSLVNPPDCDIKKDIAQNIKRLEGLKSEEVYAIRMTFDLQRRADFNEQEWNALLQTATNCLKSLENQETSIKSGLETTKELYELAKSADWLDGSLTLSFAQENDVKSERNEVVEQDKINAQTVTKLQIMFEIERENSNYDAKTWQDIVARSIACGQRFADSSNDTFNDVYGTMDTIFEQLNGTDWTVGAVHITMSSDEK